MYIAGTGHRPPRLGLGYDAASRQLLLNFAKEELSKIPTITRVISGGAQGWDQAIGFAAQELGLETTVAVPFDGQESKWPTDAKRIYNTFLAKATEVVIVTAGKYAPFKFYLRDRWMVDHSQLLIALLDSKIEKSGTKNTVDYALTKKVMVKNVWADWCKYHK